MNLRKRSSLSGSATPTSRSRSNTLSQPLHFTSIPGASTPNPPPSSATRRNKNGGSAAPSRRGSPVSQPNGVPSPAPQTSQPPPHPFPSSGNASTHIDETNESAAGRERGSQSPTRVRSQSSASLSQTFAPSPPQLFAGPGGYYAYPIFAQQGPPSDASGLRASYSSPHLPYAFAADPNAVHAHAQQQMPPPYSYPYAFQMGQPPPPPPPQPLPPIQTQSSQQPPPPPPLTIPSSGNLSYRERDWDRERERERDRDRDRRESSSDDERLAFASGRRRRGPSRQNSWHESPTNMGLDYDDDLNEESLALRRLKKKRSSVMVDETETDEPTNPLPTARRPPSPIYSRQAHSGSLFRHRHPILVQLFPPVILVFRLLSIVPASFACGSHLYDMIDTSRHLGKNTRVDYFISLLWAILTAHQCLAFTNGLFLRWKAYYPLVPTLIRLLALQAICWPATHFTLTTFDHTVRPLMCWVIIGTTTCVSRSIQIWATSNLGNDARGPKGRRWRELEKGRTRAWLSSYGLGINVPGTGVGPGAGGLVKRWWDWKEVGLKCVLPAGVLYFVTAWALLICREIF